ncbi:hypothetical protein ACP4OV_018626 [Aristida adscensionis]
MPKRHILLPDFLSRPLLRDADAYGHVGNSIKTPIPNACAMAQGILKHIIDNHRIGLSWEGRYSIDDMELCGSNHFVIRKPPKQFVFFPEISKQMIKAMEKDFSQFDKEILSRFEISHLFSGIHHACWSYDDEDSDANFKRILGSPFTRIKNRGEASWTDLVTKSGNVVLQGTLKRGAEKELISETYLSFSTYYRNLLPHGTEHSRSRENRRIILHPDGSPVYKDHKLKPCKQHMESLDEIDLGASVYLSAEACEVLEKLLSSSSMTEMYA